MPSLAEYFAIKEVMGMFEILAWIAAAWLIIPFACLTIELLASFLPASTENNKAERPRLAVLVPAHNEEAGIGRTITQIVPQLHAGDRLLVVADNCTDRTAEVARQLGALAIERTSDFERGKGYALDFGLKHLAADPPEVVVVVDADTAVDAQTVASLARATAQYQRPVQGTNLLLAANDAGPGTRISAFAFLLKNYIRPRGLNRLGLPCLLYGTGMALPYGLMIQANLAHGDITEDIRLGLDLALLGRPPRFCPEARVYGEMPSGAAAAQMQRRRWEHGHLQTLLRHVPQLLWNGIKQRRIELIALALHIGVPPLSFLFLMGLLGVAILAAFSQFMPALVLAVSMAVTIAVCFLAWLRFGRAVLPWRDLLLMPVYVFKKIPLYLGFLTKPQKEWVRTARVDNPTNVPDHHGN